MRQESLLQPNMLIHADTISALERLPSDLATTVYLDAP